MTKTQTKMVSGVRALSISDKALEYLLCCMADEKIGNVFHDEWSDNIKEGKVAKVISMIISPAARIRV